MWGLVNVSGENRNERQACRTKRNESPTEAHPTDQDQRLCTPHILGMNFRGEQGVL